MSTELDTTIEKIYKSNVELSQISYKDRLSRAYSHELLKFLDQLNTAFKTLQTFKELLPVPTSNKISNIKLSEDWKDTLVFNLDLGFNTKRNFKVYLYFARRIKIHADNVEMPYSCVKYIDSEGITQTLKFTESTHLANWLTLKHQSIETKAQLLGE